MAEVSLDCRQMPCPQPVLKCRSCVTDQAPASLLVLVDNSAAKDNVGRFLTSQGYAVTAQEDNGQWLVLAERDSGSAGPAPSPAQDPAPAPAAPAPGQRTLVFISSDTMGRGDDDLGAKLMFNFLATLPELGPHLWRVILVNGAVRLAVAASPCLEKIKSLADSGVSILVCGTCLEHFGLIEQKMVGETTNMLDVVTSLHLADKVIKV
ncbi:MAG: sulfurtransferase-like selenium metabolism protein YedF [Desulfovibrionaceae bacterium]|nr:sulfurtransferase-like selenium metabolism protein YedF [Desulfovibrionaceae bacterium]